MFSSVENYNCYIDNNGESDSHIKLRFGLRNHQGEFERSSPYLTAWGTWSFFAVSFILIAPTSSVVCGERFNVHAVRHNTCFKQLAISGAETERRNLLYFVRAVSVWLCAMSLVYWSVAFLFGLRIISWVFLVLWLFLISLWTAEYII